jgi:Domain of Unknown Function (DUF1259)
MKMRTLLVSVLVIAGAVTVNQAAAQDVPTPYREVLTFLGRQGDFKANVLKVNIPRNDVNVTVANVKTPTPFGFGGWIALTRGEGGMDVMMGDLVLLQDEVNPVMSALLNNGLDVTALHNHFFWDEPRMFYLHVHGRAAPMELARKVKPALDLIGKQGSGTTAGDTPPKPNASTTSSTNQLDVTNIVKIVGHEGEQTGSVYKITIGRDDLKVSEMGAMINARMGLNTWAAFVGTNSDAAIAGDVAMLASEVTPVLKALRQHGLDVVAIHHHMTDTTPAIFFLHYWGTGGVDRLATGFKAALDELGKHPSTAMQD